MLKKYLKNEKGFTMIEMMVVLIIIAVLIGGGIKFYIGYVDKAKMTKAKAEMATIQAALDSYYAEEGEYPEDAKDAGLTDDMVGTNGKYSYTRQAPTDSDKTDTYTITTVATFKNNKKLQATGTDGEAGAITLLKAE